MCKQQFICEVTLQQFQSLSPEVVLGAPFEQHSLVAAGGHNVESGRLRAVEVLVLRDIEHACNTATVGCQQQRALDATVLSHADEITCARSDF